VTGARLLGLVLLRLLSAAEPPVRDAHWLDWERDKAIDLLRATRRAA
jgi:hypothetical protein